MKKIFCTLLAVTLCFTFTISTFATDASTENRTPNIEIINLSDNISEQAILEITNSVGAVLKSTDGITIAVDSTVTIEDAPFDSFSLQRITPTGDNYIVTVTADTSKLVSNSGDKNTANTSASATLQLRWLDGPGLSNVIEKVSGTLTITRGTVTSGTVRYGDGTVSAINWTTKNVGAASSFNYSSNWTVVSPKAEYSLHFKDELFQLLIYAEANIFQ